MKQSKEQELQELMLGMDIPTLRRDVSNYSNLAWLGRNIGIRNSAHPNYTRAITLIKELLQEY